MGKAIEVVDLFAGPGGLGEGFSAFKIGKYQPFKIAISIEKEKYACETLTLRSFYRQFKVPPKAYYDYLHGLITKEELYAKYPEEVKQAQEEAYHAELGGDAFPHDEVMSKIKSKVKRPLDSIVIGGPPCQAYSLAGRSKMAKQEGFATDPRHTLYKEYLKIIADLNPALFVMENVKGILSSKLDGEFIFDKILADLKAPVNIHEKSEKLTKANTYTVYSLVVDKDPDELDRTDFIIKSEDYGIPQCRHRVILLAVRNDLLAKPDTLKKAKNKVSIADVIADLPAIRSGLSKEPDSAQKWLKSIQSKFKEANLKQGLNRGDEFIVAETLGPAKHKGWYIDKKLKGVLNHTARTHIRADLHRYYFYAEHAEEFGISPKLEHLPKALLPKHKNVNNAIKSKSLFNDRFRVQLKDQPATTITSHISKDGHYFIHYDKSQCRSLTVREAARIQTFPDNYKFEGPRTAQYHQVGNAVPPYLAAQIARVVKEFLDQI